MKKLSFFATLIAGISITSCTNNDYLGDQQQNLNENDGAIAFSMKSSNTVRSTGQEAAEKLNEVFFVYGTKHINEGEDATKTNDQVVFNNYKVEYKASTASTTNSNTHDWEYVGKKLTATEKQQIVPSVATDNEGQTIKYWDYGAKGGYTFYAFSALPADINSGNVKVEKIVPTDQQNASTVYDKGYTVTVQPDALIEHLYFSARKTMEKPQNPEQYGVVDLNFYNIGSKIRMGFYETIQGYDVKIKNLTIDCPYFTPKNDGSSKVTVKYDSNTATLNQPLITTAGFDSQNSLDLGNYATTPDKIGENYNTLTWTKSGGIYTPVWPQSELTSGFCKVTVDYTLTSTSDDTNEKIEVTGATAEVPIECIKWRSNYAYTYVFKISKQTNGTTGDSSDPAGLYPITFDALVTENEIGNNDFLTTVSELSVTATQDEAFLEPDKAVFKKNKAITLRVMQNGSEVSNYTLTAYYLDDYQYTQSFSANVNGKTPVSITPSGELPTQPTQGYYALKIEVAPTTTYVVLKVGE